MQLVGNRFRVIIVIMAMTGLFACSSTPQPWSQEQSPAPLPGSDIANDESFDQSPSDPAIMREETAAPIEPTTTMPLADEPSDLWQRIRQGYQLDIEDLPPSVIHQRDWYINNPEYLTIVIDRARPFIHYISDQIEKSGLPMELVLLPIVESTYDPYAYSPSHAAGLWQFIPSTARQFGLERNRWFEGRRDVVASTNAAIAFLTYLHQRFDNNWLHALAAYNSGEGNVRKAIRANEKSGKPTNFWNLDLPRETRNYVPQLLALTSLVKNPEEFSFKLPSLDDKPFFTIVELEDQISLEKVIQLTAVEESVFNQLNAAYRRSLTPPNVMSRLLLPVSKAHALQDYIATTDPKFWMPYVEYSVVSGDTLSHLALKFNSKVSVIKRANQLSSNRLKIGQTLFIPREDQLNIYPSKSRYTIVQYRIKPGDTLSEIAETYATSVQELRRQNNLANNLIRAGDIIDVRTMARASGKADLRKMSYKVRQGDSLYLIAKRFSLSVADITKWNSLNPKRYLQPGQLLTLFIDRKII